MEDAIYLKKSKLKLNLGRNESFAFHNKPYFAGF